MPKKDLLSQIAEELPKYRLTISRISLLPFALHVYITYIPTGEKVGEIIWNLIKGVRAYLVIVISGKRYVINYDNGEWSISEQKEG